MQLTQFSKEFKDKLKLEIGRDVTEEFRSVTSLRYLLEAEMEAAQAYVDPLNGPAEGELDKYKRVRKLYSMFMEEFNEHTLI